MLDLTTSRKIPYFILLSGDFANSLLVLIVAFYVVATGYDIDIAPSGIVIVS